MLADWERQEDDIISRLKIRVATVGVLAAMKMRLKQDKAVATWA